MTDFKVKPGVDSFRVAGRRYVPGEVISVQNKNLETQLKANSLVEEIKPTKKTEEKTVVPIPVPVPVPVSEKAVQKSTSKPGKK